jgi:DNA-binding NtrC family response regulator
MSRLPIVLVVDPRVESRVTMWRLLNRSFGILEAADARGAHEWLKRRQDIDALVVRKELPDADGGELVNNLAAAWVPAAVRAIVIETPEDVRAAVVRLTRWFFARDTSETRTPETRFVS